VEAIAVVVVEEGVAAREDSVAIAKAVTVEASAKVASNVKAEDIAREAIVVDTAVEIARVARSVKAVDTVEASAEIAREASNAKEVTVVDTAVAIARVVSLVKAATVEVTAVDTVEIAKEVNNVKVADIAVDTVAIAKEVNVVLIVAEEDPVVVIAVRPCQPLLKWTMRRISRPSAKSSQRG